MNGFKTFILMVGLTLLLMLVGDLIGNKTGMYIAFIFAMGMNFVTYWFSDKIVLRMYGAQEITEAESPQLFSIVHTLTQRANIPMPRVYLIPQESPNAFATGRNPQHAAVAVTEGLMRNLTPDEIEGVLAHELGHVRNRDILISTIAAGLAGAIMLIARMAGWAAMFGGIGRSDDDEGGGGNIIFMLLLIIVAPLAALLIQLAISRSREYKADESGAELSGNPMYLANALRRLEATTARVPMQADAATAHMFIVNPLRGTLGSLFSTHPPIEERIHRLEDMAAHVSRG